MKINHAMPSGPVLSIALALTVSACAAPTMVPPASRPPVQAPRPAPAPAPLPAPLPKTVSDWRDAPQTQGNWRYASGVARFGPGEATLFAMVCDRNGRTMNLIRTGSSTVALPMTVSTSTETRPLSAEPGQQGQSQLIARLPVNDALLDAMAFSRGRFAVDVNGLPSLYLPAWAEVGRVIEDCRR